MRFEKLHDLCNAFGDVMRPESLMKKHLPQRQDFHWDSSSRLALCSPHGVGRKAFESLFFRAREAGDNKINSDMKALKENFPIANKMFKKAVIVRHPMERLLSVYR